MSPMERFGYTHRFGRLAEVVDDLDEGLDVGRLLRRQVRCTTLAELDTRNAGLGCTRDDALDGLSNWPC